MVEFQLFFGLHFASVFKFSLKKTVFCDEGKVFIICFVIEACFKGDPQILLSQRSGNVNLFQEDCL